MNIGFWMLVGALIFDVVGVGKRQWANRIALILAMGGMVRLIAPSELGGLLRGVAAQAAAWLGDVVGQWSPGWGSVISQGLIPAVALLSLVMLLMMFLPGHPMLGDAATGELESKWIWGGALMAALFVNTIPGPIGDFFRTVVGLGVQVADTGTSAVVALGVGGGA